MVSSSRLITSLELTARYFKHVGFATVRAFFLTLESTVQLSIEETSREDEHSESRTVLAQNRRLQVGLAIVLAATVLIGVAYFLFSESTKAIGL